MNPAKTKLSFDVGLGDAVLPRNTYTAKDGQQFLKWCGLLINVRTMELQADYTRYAGAKLSASLTIPLIKVAPMIDWQSLGTDGLSRILLAPCGLPWTTSNEYTHLLCASNVVPSGACRQGPPSICSVDHSALESEHMSLAFTGAREGAGGQAVRAPAAQVPRAAAGRLHELTHHRAPQCVPDDPPGRHEAALPGECCWLPAHALSALC